MMPRWLWATYIIALIMPLFSQVTLAQEALAQEKVALKGEVIEYGYYDTLEPMERKRNYSTATGYVRSGGEVRLVEQTADIPLQLGRLFGFKFRISGFPRDEVAVNLKLVVTHPEVTRPNGTKVSGYSYPVAMDVAGGTITNQTGYKFDRDYELVEGQWSFQYWLDDQMIVEQTFNTVSAQLQNAQDNAAVPSPAAADVAQQKPIQ
ncbi:DUF3859 domain-containing protein [Kaarinaea lacus]